MEIFKVCCTMDAADPSCARACVRIASERTDLEERPFDYGASGCENMVIFEIRAGPFVILRQSWLQMKRRAMHANGSNERHFMSSGWRRFIFSFFLRKLASS